MKQITLILTLLFSVTNIDAQNIKFRDYIDRDSLFKANIQKLPLEMHEEYKKMHETGNEQEKEFILFMLSMPKSSKKELIIIAINHEDFEIISTESQQ